MAPNLPQVLAWLREKHGVISAVVAVARAESVRNGSLGIYGTTVSAVTAVVAVLALILSSINTKRGLKLQNGLLEIEKARESDRQRAKLRAKLEYVGEARLFNILIENVGDANACNVQAIITVGGRDLDGFNRESLARVLPSDGRTIFAGAAVQFRIVQGIAGFPVMTIAISWNDGNISGAEQRWQGDFTMMS